MRFLGLGLLARDVADDVSRWWWRLVVESRVKRGWPLALAYSKHWEGVKHQ